MKVYPAKASAMNVRHPEAGAPRVEGCDWPDDSFTFRRIEDGSFTQDAAKAYRPPTAEVKAAEKPSAADEKPADQAPVEAAPKSSVADDKITKR